MTVDGRIELGIRSRERLELFEIDADGLTRRQRHQSLQVVGVVSAVSVQNEVLKQEDDVEEDGDESDAELGEVAEETDPV